MKYPDNWKKLLFGGLALTLCLLSGCTGNPDNREDPLAGHNVDALLPFGTRIPAAAATATPTPAPGSTAIISVTQSWQNEGAPSSEIPKNPTPTPYVARRDFERLEQGDESAGVMDLQKRLIELGYLTGSADGRFGANTKTAVKLFQKALGLSQTGVATISLQEKLFLATAPAYKPSDSVVAPPSSGNESSYQALVRGDQGEAVRQLQERLIRLGYLKGGADGKFGANTETAIRAFQAQLGLSQTGVASASVQNKLYSDTAPYAPVTVVTQRPTATPKPNATAPANQGLEPGDKGTAVTQMQTRLKQLGYFSGNATGNYYNETTEAVKRFQAAIGHSQDGIASAAMLTRLYASDAPVYSAATSAPTSGVEGYTTLQRGSKGTEVRNLQKRLIELGYMTTKADGDYGTLTVNAVKLFQAAVGYEQNGVASVGLQNLLYSAIAPVYRPSATLAPSQVPTQVPTQSPSGAYQQLQPGDSGEKVKALQTRLKQLGYFNGSIGGNYLTKTTDAVRLFQAAIGHAQTGVATYEMQSVLYSSSAPDYNSVESEYITLEKLDSGRQVMYMQQRLIELGYLTGYADGDFGSGTERAVKAFQASVGLRQTGVATPETQQLLFSADAPYAPISTQTPTQAPTQVPTQVPTQAPAGYETLSYGSTGTAVQSLQSRLLALGYYEGEIGGNFKSRTETAVKLFQSAIGFQPNGIASSDVQALLYSPSAPYFDGSCYIELQSGMESVSVRLLQQRLINLGYLEGKADGDFGSDTANAVKRFQAAVGYNQDGIASVNLQSLLFSDDAPHYTRPEPTVKPTDKPAQEGNRDLSYGMEGDDVYALQNRLYELGYLDAKPTGNYRGKTEEAVKLFQQTIGYAANGVADLGLQGYLFSEYAPRYEAPQPTQAPQPGYPTLSHGDSGESVKSIQRRLRDLGYFDGEIGGNYLDKTEAAVKRFQAAIGYYEDGVATPELQEILFSSNAPSYSKPSESEPSTPDQLTVLRPGDSSSSVKRLQQRLIELGWLSGKADGDFGNDTANALKQFQFRMGLQPDGVGTIEVQQYLYDMSAPAWVEYHELLPGDTGNEVLAMQNRLIELGFLEFTEANQDGIYGNSLTDALMALQLASGVDPNLADGIATVELQTLLFSETALQYSPVFMQP